MTICLALSLIAGAWQAYIMTNNEQGHGPILAWRSRRPGSDSRWRRAVSKSSMWRPASLWIRPGRHAESGDGIGAACDDPRGLGGAREASPGPGVDGRWPGCTACASPSDVVSQIGNNGFDRCALPDSTVLTVVLE
jgi:hypothetical protein